MIKRTWSCFVRVLLLVHCVVKTFSNNASSTLRVYSMLRQQNQCTSHIVKRNEKKDSTTNTVMKRTWSSFVRKLPLVSFAAKTSSDSILIVSCVYSFLRQQNQYTSYINKRKGKRREISPQAQ